MAASVNRTLLKPFKNSVLQLMRLQNARAKEESKRYYGQTLKVLVDGPSSKNPDMLTGRTSTHKIVLFKSDDDLKGKFVDGVNGKLDILSENGPMDVQAILNEARDTQFNGFSDETIVGHLHLHVSELIETKKFYQSILGLDTVIEIPNSAVFMSYGKYHHHIAINVWNGKGVKQADSTTPGLIVANLSVPSIDFLNKVETRLNETKYPYTKKDHSLIVNDPSGNQYQLILNS